jgi:hypothetical protein
MNYLTVAMKIVDSCVLGVALSGSRSAQVLGGWWERSSERGTASESEDIYTWVRK